MTQHDKLRVDHANDQLRQHWIEQDQIHHTIDDLNTPFIDGSQLRQIIRNTQTNKVAQSVRID
jgi:ribosomal 50S subunit-associated protein YjgA (DUF615 family)